MRTIAIMSGIVLAALGACSGAPEGVYAKPGVTQEQVARDRAECLGQAAATDTRAGTLSASERQALDTCMRARGYSPPAAPSGGGY